MVTTFNVVFIDKEWYDVGVSFIYCKKLFKGNEMSEPVNYDTIGAFLIDMSVCGDSMEKHLAKWDEHGNRTLTAEERKVVRRFLNDGLDGYTLSSFLLGKWIETTELVEKLKFENE